MLCREGVGGGEKRRRGFELWEERREGVGLDWGRRGGGRYGLWKWDVGVLCWVSVPRYLTVYTFEAEIYGAKRRADRIELR